MKTTNAVIGDLKRHICPVWRFSERKVLSSDYSTKDRKYILKNLDFTLDKSLIAWSH